ncbi:MAG: N-6 DNA methylase [bacterium]|nr:N-6 DNA methylase [bacterium]
MVPPGVAAGGRTIEGMSTIFIMPNDGAVKMRIFREPERKSSVNGKKQKGHGVMNRKKDIIKSIQEISGSRSPYDVFQDWVKCMALAIQNSCYFFHDNIWKKREDEYLKTIAPYGKDVYKIQDMTCMLVETMEEGLGDILGEIYMESKLGNKSTGQFFTPFSVSYMCAKINLANLKDTNKQISLHEPTCGSGGMILASAKALKDEGINYQRKMSVTAQDLDWKAVYMCYVQCSFYGVRAVVVQGDTLSEPFTEQHYPPERVFYTPAKMGLLI